MHIRYVAPLLVCSSLLFVGASTVFAESYSDCSNQFDACKVPCNCSSTECWRLYNSCSDNCSNQRQACWERVVAANQETTPQASQPELQPELQAQPQPESPPQTQPDQLSQAPTGSTSLDSVPLRVVNYDSLKPGDHVQTGLNERAYVTLPDGSVIELNSNSSFEVPGSTHPQEYTTLSGQIHFFFEKLKNKLNPPLVIRNNNAVVAVRGTEFIVDTKADQATVQVFEGSVSVSDAKGKKSVSVIAGQQVTAGGKGPGKVTKLDESKLDHWYNQIPPSTNLIEQSVTKMASVDNYAPNCVLRAKPVPQPALLDTDEQRTLNWYNRGASSFAKTTKGVIMYGKKKISLSLEKKNASGTSKFDLRLIGDAIYYQLAGQAWKTFKDGTFSQQFLTSFHQQSIADVADISTLHFHHWSRDSKSNRQAQYEGSLTQEATNHLFDQVGLVASSTSSIPGAITVTVDLRNHVWTAYTEKIDIGDGRLSLPLVNTCDIRYGDTKPLDVTAPKGAKRIDAKMGAVELITALSSL